MLVLKAFWFFVLLHRGNSDCICGQNRLGVTNHDDSTQDRIIGGENAAEGELGWQVGLASRDYSEHPIIYCGGTLLNEEWVMTAAHCTQNGVSVAVLGFWNTQQKNNYTVINVLRVVDHPKFNDRTLNNDFSLVQLARAVDFTSLPNVFPACWPTQSAVAEGAWAIVSGWGLTSVGGSTSSILKKANLTIVSKADCNDAYRGAITDNMLCANETNQGSCQGDAGGPLVSLVNGSFELIGVNSYGMDCANSQYPAVYAYVSSVLDWIKTQTGVKEACPPVPCEDTICSEKCDTAEKCMKKRGQCKKYCKRHCNDAFNFDYGCKNWSAAECPDTMCSSSSKCNTAEKCMKKKSCKTGCKNHCNEAFNTGNVCY